MARYLFAHVLINGETEAESAQYSIAHVLLPAYFAGGLAMPPV